MRRVFWLGLGVAVGVLVVRKLTKTAESYSPKGLAASASGSVTGLLDAVRDFVEDARVAAAEREQVLRDAIERGDDVAHLGEGRHSA